MAKCSNIPVEGTVSQSLGKGNYRVSGDHGQEILCKLSGKMRTNFIRVIPGDRVVCEVSPYDLTRGIIVSRNKVNV